MSEMADFDPDLITLTFQLSNIRELETIKCTDMQIHYMKQSI